MVVLEVKGLNKEYGKGDLKVKALNNINLKINKGEFVAIVGPSGSGKSTLLHMLGAVDRPTSGNIIIDGKDISNMKEKELAILRRRNIGFIFQAYNLIPVLTAEENIKTPALLDGKKIDEKYFEKLVKVLGLNQRKDHLPAQLSGGQQQRVAIGRALINNPSIVLADEPTGNLDSKSSKEIINLLKQSIKEFNQTLILITHDNDIALLADRIIRIEDGEITINDRVRSDINEA